MGNYEYQSIAWDLAEKHHQGQRYGKFPYTYHLNQVCEGVRRSAKKLNHDASYVDQACAVAILHDILEDTECTSADLLSIGLPIPVVEAVDRLTKIDGESYEGYIHHILHDSLALMVKREDTMMNLTQSQHEGSVKRVNKYATQLARLYS